MLDHTVKAEMEPRMEAWTEGRRRTLKFLSALLWSLSGDVYDLNLLYVHNKWCLLSLLILPTVIKAFKYTKPNICDGFRGNES